MTHHLEPVPLGDDEALAERSEDPFGPESFEPIPRPRWWRWVAAVVIAALVLATPVVYAIDRILD